jgi:hypothetical protein
VISRTGVMAPTVFKTYAQVSSGQTGAAWGHHQEVVAPTDPDVGAIDTDIHLYLPDEMASVAPCIPVSWRQTFEMRGAVDCPAVRATARTTSRGVRI